ncbi:conserved hypothetical protein [Sphingomonas sp. EC-HK361]|nr:conserved hypothetical protein [Sphingomonas sp. EC-HK361]
MAAVEDETTPAADPPDTPRRRRKRRAAGWLAVLLIGVLAALWLVRVPIATGVVDRTFRAKSVPARYRIADLGLGRQRLTGVVIGDPAHPDLVADWIETQTDIGLTGATVTGVRLGHVRARARLVNGRLSLGAIDRLLPAPSGGPFALPAIAVDAQDVRLRVETPGGVVGVKIAGKGRLDDGFRGSAALTALDYRVAGCEATRPDAVLALRIVNRAPQVTGPVRVAALRCAGGQAQSLRADVDARLSPALDRWRGGAKLAVTSVAAAGASVRRVGGTIGFDGTAKGTIGTVDLASGDASALGGRAASLRAVGRYAVKDGAPSFVGRIGGDGVRVPDGWRARVRGMAASADATPAGPLVRRLAGAIDAAVARGLTVDSQLAASPAGVMISQAALRGVTGARMAFDGGGGIAFTRAGVRIDGTLDTGGGGLPDARISVAQTAPGAPMTGTAEIAPYAAGGARLALSRVSFAATPGGRTAIRTVIRLDGPVGDGRVEGLTLPIDARWDGRGTLVVDRGCVPVAWSSLRISSLSLAPARLPLCATEGALLRLSNGAVSGGAGVDSLQLAGTLGGSPLTLGARTARLSLAGGLFDLTGVEARLGAADRQTRLDIASLDGRLADGGVAGRFGDAGGQIGKVPLILSNVGGDWRFAKGTLALSGALKVADAADQPRFEQLDGRAVTLTLKNGRIAAAGTLFEPTQGRKVADVTLAHDLSSGNGSADLAVPGITFDKDFQPPLLTRLTFGVIADVRGEVHGAGRIDWTPGGVTSSGDFATDGTDLAAAFGPVTGIAGKIHFTDLLALESAPGQVATVKTINPGIAVEDGRIVYQTYAGARVLVNGGKWPFAGGTLSLDPTLLDFSSPTTRRMTFQVAGMDAGQFLQQFDFKNINATGTFDGTLPMLFDASGGRIEGGHLIVRPGGGTLAYVGDLTEKDLGTWGNLAFQALRSLRYRSLDIVMNGPLAGEMVTEVRFAGISQGEGAKSNFLIRRLQKLPFVFNIRIAAPFRGLIDTAQSFYDPKRLIERNLKPLIEEQEKRAAPPATPANPSIQPPASENLP